MTSPPTLPVEHWNFQVDSPFRAPAEIRELASTAQRDGVDLPSGVGSSWAGMGDVFGEDLALAEDEFEAYDELEATHEDEAYDEAELTEADLLEEVPASEHPLAAVFSLPRVAFDAMAKGVWGTAIAIAVGAGLRDVNQLTNMVFWFKHPQLIGQKIRADRRDLAREWLQIRDQVVKPALAGGVPTGPAAPSGPSTPAPPAIGKRTSIPSDGLRWFGPASEETPELMAFMRKVYDLHVKQSTGDFVDTLPDGALDDVESGKKARRDAAAKAREMLAAARAKLAAEGLTDKVRIGVLSAYRSADHQFDIWQGKTTKGKGGFPHYHAQTKATRRNPKYGGEHSDKAAAYLAQYIAQYVAAPGYSNHQDGLALDLGTRKGKGGLIKLYKGSWFHDWMRVNARTYQFEPLASEAWHWTYRPTAGASEAETWEFQSSTPFLSAEKWASEVTPAAIKAGKLEVQKIPLLASHRGHAPDLILGWNEMPTVPAEIDVVVHLHGYSWPTMTLPKHIEVWAGLDLAPVDGASGAGRSRPTLTVLPRGHFTGVKVGKICRYTFPALTTKDGLTTLVRVAVEHFANQVGGSPPKVGRLIMTAHSGGGAPLMQILRRHDPHEVHVFDGLYQDPSALAEWAGRHITADRAAVQAGGVPSGAMRVFFGPSSRLFSTRLHNAIAEDLRDAPTSIADRYRVESSRLGHWQIARQYGWRLLADVGADVPDAKRPPPTERSVKRLLEVGPATVPSLPETPFPAEELDSADADEAEAWEFGETATEGKEEVDQLGGPEAEGEAWFAPVFEDEDQEDEETPGDLGSLEALGDVAEFGSETEAIRGALDATRLARASELEGEALQEFADEQSEAEDHDEIDETYEQWSDTGDNADEAKESFEADHVPELEPLELSAELAPDDERLLDGGEIDETGAEARGGDEEARSGKEAEFEDTTSWGDAVFRAIFGGERRINALVRIGRGAGGPNDRIVRTSVLTLLRVPFPRAAQAGGIPCEQHVRKLAPSKPDTPRIIFTGRYESKRESGTSNFWAINQAGNTVIAIRTMRGFSVRDRGRASRGYRELRGDLQADGTAVLFQSDNPTKFWGYLQQQPDRSMRWHDGSYLGADGKRVFVDGDTERDEVLQLSADNRPTMMESLYKSDDNYLSVLLRQREWFPLTKTRYEFLFEGARSDVLRDLLAGYLKTPVGITYNEKHARQRAAGNVVNYVQHLLWNGDAGTKPMVFDIKGSPPGLMAHGERARRLFPHGHHNNEVLAAHVAKIWLAHEKLNHADAKLSFLDWLTKLAQDTKNQTLSRLLDVPLDSSRAAGTYRYRLRLEVATLGFFVGYAEGSLRVERLTGTKSSETYDVQFATLGKPKFPTRDVIFDLVVTTPQEWMPGDFEGTIYLVLQP
jgi:hypothetical protein